MRELSRTWGENQTGTIARCVERAYQQEKIRMDKPYILFIGSREYRAATLQEMAELANADSDDGLTRHYYIVEDGERRPLNDEEYAELEA